MRCFLDVNILKWGKSLCINAALRWLHLIGNLSVNLRSKTLQLACAILLAERFDDVIMNTFASSNPFNDKILLGVFFVPFPV